MLIIEIPAQEAFDESTGKFMNTKAYTLKLEHSLLSLTKWEGKHHKYFLGNENLSSEEILDYIKCMTLNQVEDQVFNYLTVENLNQIKNYIKDPMTATWFDENTNKKRFGPKNKEIITAEIIYSSMIILGIPVEIFEKRHLNHLITLIRVCNEKQNPDDKKQNPKDLANHYYELNKARRAKLKTKG